MTKSKGYIHLYTGNGKGKTTAALGLALRAVGAGKRVFIGQFVKGMVYSEVEAIAKYLPNITIKQYGFDCFIVNQPILEDIERAKAGLAEVARIINGTDCELVILDEVCVALHYNLFSLTELLDVLQLRRESIEVVMTGRYAPEGLISVADLVTEMTEVKHYYTQGVAARKGIEY